MVGVTYSEFLSWYDCGEIRICSNRVVNLEPTPDDGTPDPENPIVPILLERIPQLNLKDEDAILLIQLKPLDMENESYEKSIIDELDTISVAIDLLNSRTSSSTTKFERPILYDSLALILLALSNSSRALP